MSLLSRGEVKFWLGEAESCEERQETELTKRNNYPKLVDYYEGICKLDEQYPYWTAKTEYLLINEYFPNINSLISSIMYQAPDITVEATKPDAQGNESLMKAALTYGFDKTKALIENRIALFDMFLAGYAAVEVGHLRKPPEGILLPDKQPEQPGLIEKAKSFLGISKTETDDKKEIEKDLVASQPPKEESYATNELTYIRRYSPLDVPLDWRAENIRDRRYNLKKIWLSKAEFDARYPQLKDKMRVGTSPSRFSFSFHKSTDHAERVLLYEFQVKKKNYQFVNIVLSPSYPDDAIDVWERPYVTNDFDMKIGTLHKYGKLYPVSMAQINKQISDTINEYVRFIDQVAKRNVTKFVVDKNKVKPGSDGESALRSARVNDLIFSDGSPDSAILPLQPTTVSPENKELLAIFNQQKEKGWSVSETRLGTAGQADLATELNIQEAGYQNKQSDIQEGLRMLINDELESLKDIIITFWDGEYFFKVTGAQMPQWYSSQTAVDPLNPGSQMVTNPLTDILTGDYNCKVDISTALKPNKERQKAETTRFMEQLVSPGVQQLLASQGKMINVEAIKNLAKEYGLNSENLFVDIQQPAAPGGLVPSSGAQNQNVLSPSEQGAIPPGEAGRKEEIKAQIMQALQGGGTA